MSTPQQSGPATLAAVLGALNDTVGELKATKDEVTKLQGEAEYLRRYGRKNRKWILFDVVVTVALSLFGYLSVHAAQSASHANSAQLALCQAGNTARAQQVTLWTHLLSLPQPDGSPPRTKAQQQQIAAFEVYIRSIFRSRNCEELGR